MRQVFQHPLAYLTFIACLGVSSDLYAGWFDSSDTISVPEIKNSNSSVPAVKYSVTIHGTKFVDRRTGIPPRNIGISTARVVGIWGRNLVLDREVSELVTNAIRKRFDDSSFQFVDDGSALYELTGVIKELTYDVKARDEIAISIESTLKEISTGKVIWSGVVVEKDSRFAGVGGNNKNDIAIFLQHKLGIVTKKTFDAISGSLMASRPDLFNIAPGTQPISGVTVLFTPGANQPAPSVIPVTSVIAPPKTGMLILSTKPSHAKVYLEGVYFGLSPLHAEVEVGIHSLDVKLDGYKTASEKISVRKDDTTEMELVLGQ